MSILIVDDSELSAKIIEVNLRKKKLETIYASNGKEALEMLESRGDIQMVITDIVMPEMDGLELLQRIRCSADFSDIPVVLCSSTADEENVRRAAQLGCRHYLVKPVQPALLMEKVSSILRELKPTIKSPKEVMEQFGLDKATYDEIEEKFRTLLEEISETLNRGVDPQDKTLLLATGRLLEAASLFGAQRLTEAVEAFQRQGPGEGSPCGGSPLERLLAELKRVLRSLPPKTNSSEPQAAS
jgi:two-component system chemotaxis response regulator CheY